jgi:hypothetical protein
MVASSNRAHASNGGRSWEGAFDLRESFDRGGGLGAIVSAKFGERFSVERYR